MIRNGSAHYCGAGSENEPGSAYLCCFGAEIVIVVKGFLRAVGWLSPEQRGRR
jgi:hypothetical protein